MAKYQFDELVKAAGSGEGIYDHLKKKEISEKEAMEDILHGSFRFSITDGYLVEKGGSLTMRLILEMGPACAMIGEAASLSRKRQCCRAR